MDRLGGFKRESFDYRILRVVLNMLEEYPLVPTVIPYGEHDIITLVVNPILRPLLSDSKCRLRWPEINAEERRCRTRRIERPDAIVSHVSGLIFSESRAFGEAKSETADFKHTAIDFIRLAVFGKDCIDVNKMNKVLLFQIIGSKITFYIEFLEDDGLYVIMELFHVDLPTSIEQLPSMIPKLDNFLDLYKTFATVSRDFDGNKWEMYHRDTLDTPAFRNAIEKSRSRTTCLVHL